MRGIHLGPVNSPRKWPVTRKMLPFDDVIMNCNHPFGPRPRHTKTVMQHRMTSWHTDTLRVTANRMFPLTEGHRCKALILFFSSIWTSCWTIRRSAGSSNYTKHYLPLWGEYPVINEFTLNNACYHVPVFPYRNHISKLTHITICHQHSPGKT